MAEYTFGELLNEVEKRQVERVGLEISPKEYDRQLRVLKELMSPQYYAMNGPTISEALHSADASILFPKAISDVLLRPREPLMIGQTLLAKTVQVDNVRSFEFPVMGALRAFDMAETQEYPEQQPSFTQHFTEVKVNKVGLMLAISEEVIRDSMWDVLGLLIEAAGYAMLRHKEEKIFNEALAKAHVVYDNDTPNSASGTMWTHGKGSDGKTPNFSVHFDDFIDAMGALVAHEYVPTDIVMHPLAWVVFAKDPILRAQFLTAGQIGQSVWRTAPQFDQSINVPWNVNYQVTPFIGIKFNAQLTNPTGSSIINTPAMISNILVLDRNQAIIVLQRDPMEMDNFEEFRRDARMVKVRERYGVAALNQGRAIAAIKNVRLEQNFAPVAYFAQVTPA